MSRRERKPEGKTGRIGEEGQRAGIGAADRYDAAFATIEEPVLKTFKKVVRTERVVNILVVSVVFDILVSVVLGLFGVKIWDLAGDANESTRRIAELNVQRTRDACESRNDFKRLDLERWLKVLAINDRPEPGETKAQRRDRIKTGKEYRAFIEKADALEDCDELVKQRLDDLEKLP